MLSKQLYIVNIRCYKIEQLKLHGLLHDVKGGGGQKQSYEQSSFQHLTVTLKCNSFFYKILVKNTTNSTNTLEKCT